MSHTKAPWTVTECSGLHDWLITNDQSEVVAEICDKGAATIANARLIAAAPEMYEALKHAERFCPCGARPEAPHTHPHVIGCPIDAAIAKAEQG